MKAAAARVLASALLCGGHAFGQEPASPPQSRTVVINGAEIRYAEQGSGETVVFLHGAGTDSRIWDALRPHIAARYRFVSYSRRHHHPNAWPDDGRSHHLAQHVEDLAELVRVLGADRVHIVAVSLGGQVAARMLARHPELVADAVLGDALLTSPQTEESRPVLDAFWSRFAALGSAVRAGDAQQAAVALVDWVTQDSDGWQKLSFDRRGVYLDNGRTLLLMVHETAPPLGCSEFAQLAAPVLVLAGAGTPAAFRLTNEQLLACLPRGAEYAVLAGAGHFWYSSHPQVAAQRILEFLARHPIAARPSR